MSLRGYMKHRVSLLRRSRWKRGQIGARKKVYLSPEERLSEVLKANEIGDYERVSQLEDEAAAANDDDYWRLISEAREQHAILCVVVNCCCGRVACGDCSCCRESSLRGRVLSGWVNETKDLN